MARESESGVFRTLGNVLVRPQSAFGQNSLRVPVTIFVFCLVLQVAVAVLLIAARPRYIIGPIRQRAAYEFSDPEQASKRTEALLWMSARNSAVGSAVAVILPKVLLFVGCYLISWPLNPASQLPRARGIFRAVVLAGVILTIGVVARDVLSLVLQRNPGPFTLAGLSLGYSSLSHWFARIDIFRIWWALVLGIGLADAVRRPVRGVSIATVLVTVGWMLSGLTR